MKSLNHATGFRLCKIFFALHGTIKFYAAHYSPELLQYLSTPKDPLDFRNTRLQRKKHKTDKRTYKAVPL